VIVDLPSWRAFLVSLSSDSDPANDLFYGRVEHVQTGSRATFSSPGELQAFMALVLDEKQQTRSSVPEDPDPS
jgi:hypothetical protein